MKTCSVTGHRPKGFPWDCEKSLNQKVYLSELRQKIFNLTGEGIRNYITGGAIGVDLDFAECIIDLKCILPITFEVAVPCPDQDVKWDWKDRKRYQTVLKKADKITLVSENYNSNCMQKRNEYMVDNSDMVIAVWNGIEKGGTWNTIKYARKVEKPIKYFYLNNILKKAYNDKVEFLKKIKERLNNL